MLLSNTAVLGENDNYQFTQLNPLFTNDLFGVQFDFNPSMTDDQAIFLRQDLLTQQAFVNTSDPDLSEDNIVSMVVHQTPDIQSTVLALEQVKRTQSIQLFGDIEWTSIVPYVKFLHHFVLPSGPQVVLTQDFLGIALKVNGSGLDAQHYQLGYGNIPTEFLHSLFEETFSPNTSTTLSVEINEIPLGIRIDMVYSNITYLFQTQGIAINQIWGMEVADKFLMIQFESVTFSVIIRKYKSFQTEGVEAISEISIGGVTNLLINEELPVDQNWTDSTEVPIEKTYYEFFTINENFSRYVGHEIQERLDLFSDISFSLLTSHNLVIFNGTETLNDIQVKIDGQNRTATELYQDDFPISETVDIFHDGSLLVSAPIRGRNFVIQEDGDPGSESLIPADTQAIALTQHTGFAGNQLFSQETSLFTDLVADSVKRFAEDEIISALSPDQLFQAFSLYFTAAQYNHEFRLPTWVGLPFTFSSLQFAVKNAPFSNLTSNGQITPFPFWSSVVILLVIAVLPRKKGRYQ